MSNQIGPELPKPCPFCGEDQWLVFHPPYDRIKCVSCEKFFEKLPLNATEENINAARTIAIRRWNQRMYNDAWPNIKDPLGMRIPRT